MMTNNFLLYGTKILADFAKYILFFPLWWYSKGLVFFVSGVWNFLSNREKSLALFVWIKNIFRPMYGQYDWQGMLISVFMRIVQIIFRSTIILFWSAVSLALVLFWLVLPPLVIYEIIFQLLPL